ncbi:hypothetical protein SAMN05660462_01016 [Proteiniborus ethanoligenes]|uniref:Uncharacterized protein n=1 Tax=Proteiniborus ethanoligenes TaxID=415015 RepID=A0A1H3N5C1_9FIRM|nr:hypothetical protein [Proteiniborus ethanoligenes]SDY84072.1 hypothetical protein SAMN05660462_01016 [Proteiniborus ethanoligenes]
MNIILLLLGLILIVVTIWMISFNNKTQQNSMQNKSIDFEIKSEDSFFIDNEIEFEEVLNNISENENKNFDLISEEKSYINQEPIEYSKDINRTSSQLTTYAEDIKKDIRDDNIEKIIGLNKSGLKAEEIAKMLGKGIREVEIIIKLYSLKNYEN